MNTDHLTMSDIRICDNATQHNTTLPLSGPTLTHGSTILEEMKWGTDYFLRGLDTLVAVLSVEPLLVLLITEGWLRAEDNELVWRRRGRDTN